MDSFQLRQVHDLVDHQFLLLDHRTGHNQAVCLHTQTPKEKAQLPVLKADRIIPALGTPLTTSWLPECHWRSIRSSEDSPCQMWARICGLSHSAWVNSIEVAYPSNGRNTSILARFSGSANCLPEFENRCAIVEYRR